MISSYKKIAPTSEAELLARCQEIEGLSFAQLSLELNLIIPHEANQRKGWIGQAIELALGADARNKASPDFQTLSIELKTIPIASNGKPAESTFITSIPLLTIHQEQWHSSQCYSKLKRILWVPIEGDKIIPYSQRRIGRAVLWSPNANQEAILADDWNHLTLLISTGQLEILDASAGIYLQVRPKAANGKALCYATDLKGNKVQTLPRGFYLRSLFTNSIINLS